MKWTPPPEFEDYRLVRLLGQGAMGTVWLAHDRVLDREVAIKFIAVEGEAARGRFFVEARTAARLHHPNVVTVHRVGEVDGAAVHPVGVRARHEPRSAAGPRRARDRGDPGAEAGAADDPALTAATVEALLRGRLRALGDAGRVELAHEALISAWPRLRLWLDEEQGAHLTRERLAVAAAD